MTSTFSFTSLMCEALLEAQRYSEDLEQKMANWAPWDKSGSVLVFVNKVLSGHSHGHSFMCCAWQIHAILVKLRSCDRQQRVCRAQSDYHLALYGKHSLNLTWRDLSVWLSLSIGNVKSVENCHIVK